MVSHDESGHISYRIDGILYHKTFSLTGSSPIPEGRIMVQDHDTDPQMLVRTFPIDPHKPTVLVMEEL